MSDWAGGRNTHKRLVITFGPLLTATSRKYLRKKQMGNKAKRILISITGRTHEKYLKKRKFAFVHIFSRSIYFILYAEAVTGKV